MLKSGKLRKFVILSLCGLFSLCNLFVLQAYAQRPDDREGDRGREDRGRDRGGVDRGRDRGGEDRGPGGPPGGGPPDGGPPGMTSERIFGFMDRNRNGTLDPDETERMPSSVKDRLKQSGFDLNKGLDQKQFGKAFEEMRKIREEDEGRRREEYENKKREENGDNEDKKSEAAPARKPLITIKPHDRVTKDIPKTFEEGDTDQDGQLAFYEWRKWKRAETDNFFTYDHNGDGFLTPSELIKGPSEAKVAALEAVKGTSGVTVISNASVSTTTNASTITPTNGGSTSVKPVSTRSSTVSSMTVDMDSAIAKRGKSTFRLLDKDRSGNVTPDEWASSSKLRPQFTDAGVDLSKPMDENAFITHFIKISS